MIVFLGFWSVFGQTWAQERAQRPRLEKRYINHRKSAREIDAKTPLLSHFFRFLGFVLWCVLGAGGLREAPGGPAKAHG